MTTDRYRDFMKDKKEYCKTESRAASKFQALRACSSGTLSLTELEKQIHSKLDIRNLNRHINQIRIMQAMFVETQKKNT